MLKQPQSNFFPHWHYQPHLPGLTGIYLNASLRTLVFGLSGIFVPIFILQHHGSFARVFLFFLLAAGSQLFIVWLVPSLLHRFGPDWAMAVSLILQIGFFLALFFSNQSSWLIWPAAIFLAFLVPLYWLPYHLAFVHLGNQRLLGQQVGTINILTRLAAALAPLFGGFIIQYFHYRILWLLIILLSIISILPIFWDEYNNIEPSVGLGDVLAVFKGKSRHRFILPFIGTGIEGALYGVIWPLFLFQVLRRPLAMGVIGSVALFFSVLLAWRVGRWVDHRPQKILRFGSRLNAVNWLLKSLVLSPYFLILIDALYQLGGLLVWLPFTVLTYYQAQKQPLAFLVGREFFIHIGWVFGLLLSWGIYSLTTSWWLVFSGGFIALLLIGQAANGASSPRQQFP